MIYKRRSQVIRTAAIISLGALHAFAWAADHGSNDTEEILPAGPNVVSIDLLRHPINERARRLLRKAVDAMNAGDLGTARGELVEMLAKYPDSAVYAQSVLGVVYVRTNRFEDAANAFEVAASLLPHDAMTHYNFALSLACSGKYLRSEQEVRRALELDPKNASAQTLLEILLRRGRAGDEPPPFATTGVFSRSDRQTRN